MTCGNTKWFLIIYLWPNLLLSSASKKIASTRSSDGSLFGGDCTRNMSGLFLKVWHEDIILNRCSDVAVKVLKFAEKNDDRMKGCVMLEDCGGLYNNGTGFCNLKFEDCYHEKNCIVPKERKLAKGNCIDKDWETNKPEYCSIIQSLEGCEKTGHVAKLAWIVDSDGVKRFITRLNIEFAQTDIEDESFWQDRRYETSGPAMGDENYCIKHNAGQNCISKASNGMNPFRIHIPSSETPIAHLGTCKTPVYCFGYQDILVFGKAQRFTQKVCTSCHVTCDIENINIVIPESTKKIVRICGRQSCQILESVDKIITIPRNFHQKITDERITVEVSDPEKTFTFNLEQNCPIMEICQAMDCSLCKLRLLNPTCYEWYHWIITLSILYFALVAFGILLISTSPIFKLLLIIIKLLLKLSLKLCGICMKKTTKNYIEMAQYVDEEKGPIYKPTTNIRGLSNKKSTLMFLVLIISLFSIVDSKAPCSNVVIDNIPTQVCKKVNDQYRCQVGSLVEVPMISYDQTSCLHFLSPNGRTLGELQITPMDLSFRCQKETLYYTRDVKYVTDHQIHCPHAGQCTEEWCLKFDKSTKVNDLEELSGPYDISCKLGPACAGSGCFFCTSSCHVIRYYPKPMTSSLYEVFYCPKWEPSGNFHIEWYGPTNTHVTTISLIHGQTASITNEIKATLQMTVQTKLPILSKNFLTNDESIAVVDTAAANQPQPGMIGHVQCATKRDAVELSRSCIVAPNACICQPTGETDNCDCSQIDLKAAFQSESQLPLTLGGDYLTDNRGIPLLKSSAYGSAFIRIHATGLLVGDYTEEEECKVVFDKMDGCHSCVIGANLTYKCDTPHPSSIVAQCDGGLNLILNCDNQGTFRTTRVHVPSPIVDIHCKMSCAKEVIRLTGILKSVGLHPINDGSHIQLSPAESVADMSSWIRSIWAYFSWWYITIIIISIIVVIAFLITIIAKTSNIIKKKRL